MIAQFFIAFRDYLIEVLPFLAIGLFLSGLIREFVPVGLVERHLGGRGIKPLLYSTLAGAVLPLCCIGSLPVAVGLHQKGARLGPVLAFLVATPATSISALLVCYALLGIKFTVFIFFAAILMGLVMGIIGNLIKSEPKGLASPLQRAEFATAEQYTRSIRIRDRVSSAFRYGFVDMVKEIGPEILLGLALAALVVTAAPVGKFVGTYLSGGLGYLFSLVLGLLMYVCSTASPPLVQAFLSQGMNIGAGLVLLLVGPITSWGTILVLRKEFGGKILLIYLACISIMALVLGYSFSLI